MSKGPFTASSRLWANCVQYVTHPSIHSRLGTESSFLLLNFGTSVDCWQATMRGEASWREMTWSEDVVDPKQDLEVTMRVAKSPLQETPSIRGSGISTASSLSQCCEEASVGFFSPELDSLLLGPEN